MTPPTNPYAAKPNTGEAIDTGLARQRSANAWDEGYAAGAALSSQPPPDPDGLRALVDDWRERSRDWRLSGTAAVGALRLCADDLAAALDAPTDRPDQETITRAAEAAWRTWYQGEEPIKNDGEWGPWRDAIASAFAAAEGGA